LNDPIISGEAQVKISDSLRTLGRLKGIVNSLLLIARIENEQYLKNEEVDISELISEVTGELRDQFDAANIVLETSLPGISIFSKANKSLLYTMFINLYGNALKYTNREGLVKTSYHNSYERLVIEIHNSGEGIDPKHLPEIFSRFKKFSSENIESHGLGLAIAKSIADFHGISLSASSEKGKGTSFTLHL
jgi:two-component system, OmpR family, sensor histidine kinase ArlS